jgi:hypothetical protein
MQVSATEQISDLRGKQTQAGQQQQMAGSEAAAGMANVSAVTQQKCKACQYKQGEYGI